MGAERFLHYRIIGPLGQGGMGEVFLAEDERLGRRVALKFLPTATASDPEARERLRREARSLAALSHPNIAAVYALESEDARSCLVMEWIEGETLAVRIARRPLPIPDAIAIGSGVAAALAHAHARGVVHRDVKPANILVTPAGVAKLTDFGIAQVAGATKITAEGFTPGTVAYMSPEQARGSPLDGRSDVFSLGAVLYEALTGVRAFAGERPEATLLSVQRYEPEPPSALRSGIPLELERVVLKCLRKDPGLRYQHADDLAADMKSLAGMATQTAPVGAGATTGRDSATATSVATPGGPRPRRRLSPRVAIPLGVVLLAAVIYLLGPYRPSLKPELPAAEAAEKTIAVLSFQNLEDPADAHGAAPIATSLLTVGLGASQVMPVLSVQRIHDVLRQMGKSSEAVRGAEALEVAKHAGAAYVVTGYIYATEPNVLLAAEVASTSDGKVLTACKSQTPGGERGLFAAVDSLTALLRDGLARAGFGVHDSSVDVASLTTQNPAAYRAYVHGLDRIDQNDWGGAAREFRSAIEADSTFALAWYYSAVATWWDSDVDGAKEEVKTALRLGNRLSGRDRDGLKALAALIDMDYSSAAQQYRALLTRYADDKEFLYGLGEALFHGSGDEDEALQPLERATLIDPAFAVAYEHIFDIEIDRGDDDAALAAAERLLGADPGNSLGTVMKALALLERGDSQEGLAVCRTGIAKDPQDWYLGRAYARAKAMTADFDSGQMIVATTAKNSARYGSVITLERRVFLPMTQGRFREAEAEGRTVVEKLERMEITDPSLKGITTFTLRTHSQALLELGRYDEAIAELKSTIVKRLPRYTVDRGMSFSRLMEAYVRAGRLRDAAGLLRDYDTMLGKTTTNLERQNRSFLAGQLALGQGRAAEAVPIFRENLPLEPVNRYFYQQLALSRSLLAAGSEDTAADILAKIIRGTPARTDFVEPFRAMILLAKYHEKRGRTADALALYKRVAYQYRMAEPGVRANEEALAGIQRLSKAS